MIISGIDICFVARLNSMVEAYIYLPMNSARFYVCNFDVNDSFTMLTIIVRKQIYSNIKVLKNMEFF